MRGFGWLAAWICAAQMALAANWTPLPAPTWSPTTWNGEKAWQSTSRRWTAVFSEERSRLVAIMEDGSTENLLYASPKQSISWGGHRCWLGPQSNWKGGWPPPADWEASAAAELKVSNNRLTVVHPHTDKAYPQLTRTYEWRGGVLHCGVTWQGESHYAVQILQIPRWSIVHLRGAVEKKAPLGYALLTIYQRPEVLTDTKLSAAVGRVEGEDITLWHGYTSEKVGVAPQEITADIGDYQLKMRPGKAAGIGERATDLGLLTQVYLGNWENPFVEIEQLSPYGSEKPAVFEIQVEPIHKKASTPRP